MTKVADSIESNDQKVSQNPDIDSKFRLILVAAQRSKQLQRGARPRVDMDMTRHKPTRIALEEVHRGKVDFSLLERE